MNNQLKNLIIFSEVYKRSGFREASKFIGMSIATISHAVQELEKDCGSKLFLHAQNEFTPTMYAHTLYEQLEDTNGEILSAYLMFKKHVRHLNLLIPPQISSEVLLESLFEFNRTHDTELRFCELSDYASREGAYDAIVRGELDFMIDIQPNPTVSFVSEQIADYPLVLVGSKHYYTTLDVNNITSSTRFAKVNWLGKVGEALEQAFGIGPNQQVGFIAQQAPKYYQMLEKSKFIGMAPLANKEFLGEGLVSSNEPFYTLKLYFVTTQSALQYKPVVAWFYQAFKKKNSIHIFREG